MRDKFVVVVLSGGLGNQMFQYACAKSISICNNYKLYIDRGFLKHDSSRSFQLNVFGISDDEVPIRLQMSRKFWKFLRLFKSDSFFLKLFYRVKLFKQSPEDFDLIHDEIRIEKRSIILWGYWQNEIYFKDIKSRILNLYNLDLFFRGKNQLIENKIYVSIHIRRGDYIKNSSYSKKYFSLSSEYYLKALNKLVEIGINNFKILVFFDEIDENIICELEKRNFDLQLIDNNEQNELLDLFHMSKCNFNIIANSSFSWWGAYLNSHSEKIVICPNNFYVDYQLNSRSNLFLNDWIKV